MPAIAFSFIIVRSGWRIHNEDTHVARLKGAFPGHDEIGFFCVFDGHGGDFAAKHCADHVCAAVNNAPGFNAAAKEFDGDDLGAVMTKGLLQLDTQLRGTMPAGDTSGCTACACILTAGDIVCGNVGDSRAVLCRARQAVALSEDHKPFHAVESARIIGAGGHVTMQRVNGDLAVSRALGDFSYKMRHDLPAEKQQVSAEAEVKVVTRDPEDNFVIICCDGIFDVMSNQDVCTYVMQQIDDGYPLHRCAERLMDECLKIGSRDNMTVVIVGFPNALPEHYGTKKEEPTSGVNLDAEAGREEGPDGGGAGGGAGPSFGGVIR